MKKEKRLKGGLRTEFVKKHGLNEKSSPQEWFRSFIPNTSDRRKNHSDFCTSVWTSYLNFKAQMVNSGQEGQLYPELNPFTVRETDKFLAVYILHGFSPSPRVDMKFKPQEDDPINGSDLVYRILGPNDERHHRHFKYFFRIQDPRYFTSSKKTHPNWKVDPFLSWIMFVSREAWVLGRTISCYEKTIGFQGKVNIK